MAAGAERLGGVQAAQCVDGRPGAIETQTNLTHLHQRKQLRQARRGTGLIVATLYIRRTDLDAALLLGGVQAVGDRARARPRGIELYME